MRVGVCRDWTCLELCLAGCQSVDIEGCRCLCVDVRGGKILNSACSGSEQRALTCLYQIQQRVGSFTAKLWEKCGRISILGGGGDVGVGGRGTLEFFWGPGKVDLQRQQEQLQKDSDNSYVIDSQLLFVKIQELYIDSQQLFVKTQ